MTVAPTSVHPGREQHRSRWVLVAILAFLLGGLAVALLYQSGVFEGSSNSTTGGSGVPATEVRDMSAFNSVELAGSNNVVIRVGAKQSIVVKADANLLDRVTTEVQSGTLVIGNTPGSFTTKSPDARCVDARWQRQHRRQRHRDREPQGDLARQWHAHRKRNHDAARCHG